MRRAVTIILRLALGGMVFGGLSLASAQTAPLLADAALAGKDTRAWLSRVQEAAKKQNFSGTFVFSSGGAMSSARISHFCEGNNQFERIESLDGPPRQVLRHNEQVHNVWPQSRVVVMEQRDARSVFPALLLGADDQILLTYEVHAKGSERVAGHEANVVQLRPRDQLRYGYRLWTEKSSGLLLRADVLGARSEVLESSAFSEVALGVKPQPEAVLSAIKKLSGYRIVKSQINPTRLGDEGWVLGVAVPGFKEVSCFKRPLDELQNVPSKNPAEPVSRQAVQVIYSDGVTHVSLFIEPFTADQQTRPTWTAVGATGTYSRRHADWWITAVGDVPLVTLRAFAEGLARKN